MNPSTLLQRFHCLLVKIIMTGMPSRLTDFGLYTSHLKHFQMLHKDLIVPHMVLYPLVSTQEHRLQHAILYPHLSVSNMPPVMLPKAYQMVGMAFDLLDSLLHSDVLLWKEDRLFGYSSPLIM